MIRKKNKYFNKKINGYDSKKENARANQLKLLEKQGYIKDLQEQVTFELQPSFKISDVKPPFKLKTIRAIKYIADFYYFDNEKEKYVVEDTKGFRTKEYVIKSKMFQYNYRDISFLEV